MVPVCRETQKEGEISPSFQLFCLPSFFLLHRREAEVSEAAAAGEIIAESIMNIIKEELII